MSDDSAGDAGEQAGADDRSSAVAVSDPPTTTVETAGADGDVDRPESRERLRSYATRGRIGVTVLVVIAVIATVCAVVFGIKWGDMVESRDRAAAQAATDSAAEKVAGDYAVRVSTFDYNDLDAWRSAVTQGVTDQFKATMQGATQLAEPILKSLQWTSTSRLMMARTTGHHDDVYTVQVFVNVSNKSLQGQYSLVTAYSVVLNKGATNRDWVISNAANTNDASALAGLPTPGAGAQPAPATDGAAPTDQSQAAATPQPGS